MQYILRMLIKSPIHGRISLIRELKRIYLAIQNQEEYFTSTEHFLPLNEIYVEQGIIVFFKKKRTPIVGYDIESGCLVKYYKKDGEVSACYQFCVGRIQYQRSGGIHYDFWNPSDDRVVKLKKKA